MINVFENLKEYQVEGLSNRHDALAGLLEKQVRKHLLIMSENPEVYGFVTNFDECIAPNFHGSFSYPVPSDYIDLIRMSASVVHQIMREAPLRFNFDALEVRWHGDDHIAVELV